MRKCTFLLHICSLFSDCAYQLTVPAEYTAFSGDLQIQYKIPEHVSLTSSFVRVAMLTGDKEVEITNLGIASQYKSGTLIVKCGIIEVAGKYEFQMYMYLEGPLLVRAVVVVRWPKIVLTLPNTHLAESSSVHLQITSQATCNPRLKRYSFQIDLEYAQNSSAISSQEIVRLSSQPFTVFNFSQTSIEFPCSLFDLSGIYRSSITSSVSAISVVSRSNEMFTSLNPAYRINIWSNEGTIFPCIDKLMVNYQLPSCPGAKERNRIRIYMLRRTVSGSIASPLKRSYVIERHVDPDTTYFMEECSLFQTVATSYCFQFVTLTRNVVINQTELCLPAHPNSGESKSHFC